MKRVTFSRVCCVVLVHVLHGIEKKRIVKSRLWAKRGYDRELNARHLEQTFWAPSTQYNMSSLSALPLTSSPSYPWTLTLWPKNRINLSRFTLPSAFKCKIVPHSLIFIPHNLFVSSLNLRAEMTASTCEWSLKLRGHDGDDAEPAGNWAVDHEIWGDLCDYVYLGLDLQCHRWYEDVAVVSVKQCPRRDRSILILRWVLQVNLKGRRRITTARMSSWR